jgi:hypothetical protein
MVEFDLQLVEWLALLCQFMIWLPASTTADVFVYATIR